MAHMNIEEFRRIYTDWQQSGQSVRAYTRSIGIKEDKFYYWQKRLKDMEKNKVVKSGSFIKMPPSDCHSGKGSTSAIAAKTPALCELVYPNGVMVRITSDLSLEGLRQLINLSR